MSRSDRLQIYPLSLQLFEKNMTNGKRKSLHGARVHDGWATKVAQIILWKQRHVMGPQHNCGPRKHSRWYETSCSCAVNTYTPQSRLSSRRYPTSDDNNRTIWVHPSLLASLVGEANISLEPTAATPREAVVRGPEVTRISAVNVLDAEMTNTCV